MAKSEFAHDEQALLDALISGNRARIRRHDFGYGGSSGSAADSNHAIHDVALRQDARQLSVAQYGQGANIVFHHETRGLEHGAGGLDGIQLTVFDEIAESGHGLLLRHSETCVDSARPPAGLGGGQYFTTGAA